MHAARSRLTRLYANFAYPTADVTCWLQSDFVDDRVGGVRFRCDVVVGVRRDVVGAARPRLHPVREVIARRRCRRGKWFGVLDGGPSFGQKILAALSRMSYFLCAHEARRVAR